jgi:hypothetical protein
MDVAMGRDIPYTSLRNHRLLGLQADPVIVWQARIDWWGHPSWTDFAAMECGELERAFTNEAPVLLIGTWPGHEFFLAGVGGLSWTQHSLRSGTNRPIRRVYITAGQ